MTKKAKPIKQTIKIDVQKTVQEVHYEPFTCKLSLEETYEGSMTTKTLDELYWKKYDEMEERLQEIINERLEITGD